MPDAKQLEGTIRFWVTKLQYDRYLMEPGTEALIQQTVNYLKELQKLKGGDTVADIVGDKQ